MASISCPLSRRNFIRTFTVAGIGVMSMNLMADQSAHIAFLSDTHVPADPENNYRGFYPYRNFEHAVKLAAAAQPQAAVISGDLARLEGLPGDYKNLNRLLNPLSASVPVAMALGNHDNRDNFLNEFPQPENESRVKGKHIVEMELGPVRILVLDSLLYVNKVAGLLGKSQRTWLAGYLDSTDDRPVVLVFHHPPTDEDGDLHDSDRLFSIINPRKKVKALVFGHSHRYHLEERDGIHLINLPATAYNFNDSEPIGWIEATLGKTGAQLTLRTIGGNQEANGQVSELNWRA